MGLITPKKYQKLNRETGRFEWVTPPPIEYKKENRGGKLKLNKKVYESINNKGLLREG